MQIVNIEMIKEVSEIIVSERRETKSDLQA